MPHSGARCIRIEHDSPAHFLQSHWEGAPDRRHSETHMTEVAAMIEFSVLALTLTFLFLLRTWDRGYGRRF